MSSELSHGVAQIEHIALATNQLESLCDFYRRLGGRMEITGPAAETVGPEIGPEISGDFPEVLAALASRAEGLA